MAHQDPLHARLLQEYPRTRVVIAGSRGYTARAVLWQCSNAFGAGLVLSPPPLRHWPQSRRRAMPRLYTALAETDRGAVVKKQRNHVMRWPEGTVIAIGLDCQRKTSALVALFFPCNETTDSDGDRCRRAECLAAYSASGWRQNFKGQRKRS